LRALRNRFPLVATLFFVSGATGLLYEVAFSKLLAYIFGATAYAVSTVLASFMAGLALGAHFGGRRAGRIARPLAAYGVLEILVGLICAASPEAFEVLTSAYVRLAHAAPHSLAAITAARAGLTALVVVVPTVAMGATLPLLSRLVTADALGKQRLPAIYAINTAGGAFGALASAYAVLPALGVRGTMHAAALTNIAIGLVAIAVGLRDERSPSSASVVIAPSTAAPRPTHAPSMPRALLALALLSGFLVFAAEVVQTHLLALLIGNSAYAFGLMLAVFLVCLALGAARADKLSKKHGDSALARGLAYTALSIALTLPLWAELPRLFLVAGKLVHGWTGRELVRALAAFGILALPTMWMGSTFPLLLRRIADEPNVAALVGRLTVANTLGTIAGSVITGYFLLPWLGSQPALIAIAVAFALAAVAASRMAGVERREQRRALAIGAAAIVVAVVMPAWDLARLTNGANVYFTAGPPPDSIAFVREDVHGGVTTIARRGALTTMYTNGKFQGDDGPEMVAQRHFAHFPSLFLKHEDRVLVVGLGTGTTLGTIASYPWKRIDVAEISPSIVEAARAFFKGPSLGALDDPRVHLELNDGRNVLLVATEPYDLITMELTSVWFAGASSLYSREFYELTRARLTPGGVLQQWVQLHHIRRRELGSIVRTLRSVYPHVALFVGGAQGILIASAEPLVLSQARIERLEQHPPLRAILDGAKLATMLDELVFSGAELDQFVAESEAPLSTDDNLYLEYATPKGNVLNYDASLHDTIELLRSYRTADVRTRHVGP
jgi:spermidine synthase